MKKLLIVSILFCVAFSADLQAQDSPCNPRLWKHIYKKDRLQIVDECITVSGTIVQVKEQQDDGDKYILLRPDQGQEWLLNEKNKMRQRGCLVLKIICVTSPSAKAPDASSACEGYTNDIYVPHQGDHVEVTGSYVIDTDPKRGWAAIHPVSHLKLKAAPPAPRIVKKISTTDLPVKAMPAAAKAQTVPVAPKK